jgi:hypothetical protein
MWSPAVTKVRQMGIACVYQPLKEGYRAWAAEDRPRLATAIADRNRPHKHVLRARIIYTSHEIRQFVSQCKQKVRW